MDHDGIRIIGELTSLEVWKLLTLNHVKTVLKKKLNTLEKWA